MDPVVVHFQSPLPSFLFSDFPALNPLGHVILISGCRRSSHCRGFGSSSAVVNFFTIPGVSYHPAV
jgi:hypothetical protein